MFAVTYNKMYVRPHIRLISENKISEVSGKSKGFYNGGSNKGSGEFLACLFQVSPGYQNRSFASKISIGLTTLLCTTYGKIKKVLNVRGKSKPVAKNDHILDSTLNIKETYLICV